MALTKFRQGDDVKVRVQIIENPVIDFSTATDIRVVLITNTDKKIQWRYSLDAQPDHGTLEVDGTNKDTINVFVEREQSINFAIGILRAEVMANFTDSDFPDGSRTKTWNQMTAKVSEGQALDEEV